MTYLELVNSVLTRLREDTVATVTETAYSALVGEFVNDAKRKVEAAWQWNDLFDYIDVPTVAGTESYATNSINSGLTAAPLREYTRLWLDPASRSPVALITTTGKERYLNLISPTQNLLAQTGANNTSTTGGPDSFYIIPGTRTANQWSKKIVFDPVPDGIYTARFYVVNPQDRLSTGSTVLTVPEDPVVLYAYLYCLYERGEELGENVTRADMNAQQSLADAIMMDQQQQNHELLFSAE